MMKSEHWTLVRTGISNEGTRSQLTRMNVKDYNYGLGEGRKY